MNLGMIKFYVVLSASELYETMQRLCKERTWAQSTGLKLGSHQHLMAEVRRGSKQRTEKEQPAAT